MHPKAEAEIELRGGERRLELAVVVPTFKERKNIVPLLAKLESALAGIHYEVVFVDDDSPDGTADVVRQIGISDSRIRVLQRVHRRGLSSACVEGMMATAAPFVAVMDADLQHDETRLPQMLELLSRGDLDIAVGTRNAAGGSMGDFSVARVRLSNLGRGLSSLISGGHVSDPMSGFFMVTRAFLNEVVPFLSAVGFKILLDILASSPRRVRAAEVPYRFSERIYGESKLDILVGLEYLQLLLDKLVGRFIPVRFILFAMVGTGGALVHLSILYLLMYRAGQSFLAAQSVGTVCVMTLNFFLNNTITYRDRRLRGYRLAAGLVTFYIACSIGAFLNLRAATFGLASGLSWYWAGILGVALSSVWNYAVTAVFTWRQERTLIRRRYEARA